MSITRPPQPLGEPLVRGYSVTHPAGEVALPVQPGWDQLVSTLSGTLQVATETGSWAVPRGHALWVPAAERCRARTTSRTALRTLYLSSSLAALPRSPRAVALTGFARELVHHVINRCPLDLRDGLHRALLTLVLDQLDGLPPAPLGLPLPRDPRAAEFVRAARDHPERDTSALAREVATSRRTLERIFSTEVGVGLGRWRRRARILDSLDLLAAGRSVTSTAMAVGYTTPSSFVVAFKRELGTTPRRFLQE